MRGEGQEEKRKMSCHKHGNQRDMKREVGIKEQKEKRRGISSLIFSLSQLCTFQSSLAQSRVTKRKKDFFELRAKAKLSHRGVHPLLHRGTFLSTVCCFPPVVVKSSPAFCRLLEIPVRFQSARNGDVVLSLNI